ncbi:MAG TPA: hypothetical protein VF292_11585 [Rhodanobacteraceae bacterium]
MNMKLGVVSFAVALAIGAFGVANATPIVTNGGFSQISTSTGVNPNTPSQVNYPSGFFSSYGEFVTGWTTTGSLFSQNVIWVPSASAASSVNAKDVDTNWPLGPRPLFPTSVTAPPTTSGSTAFMAMQANLANSGIQQNISGLTVGQSYTLSFYWAATMDNIDTGVETSQLTASVAGQSFKTITQTVSSNNGFLGLHSTPTFNGWLSESFTFVADTSSSVLKFIANGTPSGLPPYALLTGVSIDALPVPEPPVLAMFGGGLLGLGLLTLAARRRRQRDDGHDAA